MATDIVRHLTPEEAELLRKRDELASVRILVAEKELELVDLRAGLQGFEGLYLRRVGVLYAELDDLDALTAELEAKLVGTSSARDRARRARQRAGDTQAATQGEDAKAPEFQPDPELRSLFREVARRVHPDFAKDEADRQRRTDKMAAANEAYARGDAEALRSVLDENAASVDSVPGEGIGSELVRIIRQIDAAKKRLAAIEQELTELRGSELALLWADVQSTGIAGRDLLGELAARLQEQIARARSEYDVMVAEANSRGGRN